MQTRGDTDVVDITPHVVEALKRSKLEEGLATVFISGSTAGITTIEFEPGLVKDVRTLFEKIAPKESRYCHEEAWHDGNGHSHLRSALLKTSLAVPFLDRQLLLGKWQQIVLIDFDNRPRNRRLVTQFVGE
ncbi:MAG: YjbQ family protein [Candidatus Omnitrophica bacterium]|nr:YjbQ family protein [Candidatus Omnitrophota bacterium]